LKTRWLATTAFLLLPAHAGSENFDYGVSTQGGWSSNVYGSGDDATITSEGRLVELDEVDDFSMRVSPWGRVSDPDGNVTWEVQYKPSYEYYLQEDDIRGFDHEAGGQVFWRLSPRTSLSVYDAFRQYRSLLRFNENAALPTEAAVLRGTREEVTGNLASVTLRHVLTPLDELSLTGQYLVRDYEQASDVDTFTAIASWRHSLDSRTSVGLRGSWSQQSFARQVGGDSVTNYYNVSGTLEHRFSRTLRFEFYAGPAWIDADAEMVSFSRRYGANSFGNIFLAVDANDCPLLNETLPHQPDDTLPNFNPHLSRVGFGGCGTTGGALSDGELELLGYPRGDPLTPGSRPGSPKLEEFGDPYELDANGNLVPLDDGDFGETELTYFARAAVMKDWERWHLQLAYQRSSDESGSFGSSSVRDTFELLLRWDAARLWTVSLTGGYSFFDQTADLVRPRFLIVENEPVPVGVTTVDEIAAVQRFVVDVDDDAISYRSGYLSLAARRRLTLHSSASVAVYWYQQTGERDLDDSLSFIPGVSGAGESTSTIDNLTLWVGLDWKFDTIKF
jgi:hypothetical protein